MATQALIIIGVFVVCLFLGFPIFFSVCIPSILALLMNDLQLVMVPKTIIGGVQSFTLLAVPFFILAGNLMNSGGITKRIFNICLALMGWIRGGLAYQAMAGYTGVGRDPVKAYIKIKAVEEKGSISVCKVDVTGSPLVGAELLLETSADGKTWTEVGRITTDKIGVAKWSDLKIGVQYRVTETKSPAGYTLLTEPLFTGTLDSNNRDITITACNNAGFALPFTGGTGFTTYFLFAALMLCMGVYFCKKLARRKTAG